jgi:hypothetical protein
MLTFEFFFLNYIFFCLGKDVHRNCKKFHQFLLDENARLYKMYSVIKGKELALNEKLLRVNLKCETLEFAVEKLKNEIEDRFYDDL